MWLPAEIITIPDIVRYWSARTPDKPMLIDDHRTVTYREVDARSDALARAVLAGGLAPGSHVGFLGKNGNEFWETWFGVTKAGSALAPLNWRFVVAELVELVEDAEISLLIVDEEFAGTAAEVAENAARPVTVTAFAAGRDSSFEAWIETWIDAAPASPPDVAVPQSRTALLAYTSGTTGAPKGVALPHRAFQYWFQISAMEPSEDWRHDEVFLGVMPNFHLAGSWVPLPCLYHGGTVVSVPAFEPQAVLSAIRDRRPSVTCLVPTAMQMLVNDPATAGADLSSLRTVYYAGSAITAEVLTSAVRTFGCELIQFYGTTETYIITLLRPEQHTSPDASVLGSCGTPMPLISVRIIDAAGDDVVEGEPGEVVVRSPTVFSGYWNKPETTREAFVDGWYRTGDIGRRDRDGNLHLIDRAKDMIVTGGENVYSVEVERALSRHEAVAATAVVGAPDDRWGERVVAFVVLHEGASVTEAALQRHCRELIAAYKTPKQIHVVDGLPITASGKVQKNALRDRLAEVPTGATAESRAPKGR